MLVHFFTQSIQIYTLLFDHLTVCITEQHYHSFELILELLSKGCSYFSSTVYKTREGLDKRSCIKPLGWF